MAGDHQLHQHSRPQMCKQDKTSVIDDKKYIIQGPGGWSEKFPQASLSTSRHC